LRSAKKHNVSFAPLKLSRHLKEQLPAWFHLGAPPRTYNKTSSECLRTLHNSLSVKDLTMLSARTSNSSTHHHARCNCACDPCKRDRDLGCANPHRCATTAKKILDKLHPKFNTTSSPRKDDLTLTHRRKEKNSQAVANRRGDIIFDPTVTAKTSLSECFRIFTKTSLIQSPAYRLQRPLTGRPTNDIPLTVYTDGSCIMNGKEDAKCGSGIWISENHPLNKSVRIPGPSQSNQVGEIAAILIALQSISPLTPITFVT
ncbi:hypothetical protein M405DRAFT_703302, partial [Rhizopogon salebrosus TDB-379]